MPDYKAIESKLMQALGGSRRPIAIAFLDEEPEGVEQFQGSQPSSCSFWRLAADGRTFYTVRADHQGCPIGAYTHQVNAMDKIIQLHETLDMMSNMGYIRLEEVGKVFTVEGSKPAILYAPLGDTPVEPSAVIISGKASRVMLIAEAANRAGEMSNLPLLGRPTCMAIPAAIRNGGVASTGCIGNRVYTEIGDDELYIALKGSAIERVAEELATIQSANQTLLTYHRERKAQLTS